MCGTWVKLALVSFVMSTLVNSLASLGTLIQMGAFKFMKQKHIFLVKIVYV